jgi:hypothetical protein
MYLVRIQKSGFPFICRLTQLIHATCAHYVPGHYMITASSVDQSNKTNLYAKTVNIFVHFMGCICFLVTFVHSLYLII